MTKKKIINNRERERREKRARIDSAIYTVTEEAAGLKHAYTLETVDSDDIGGVCV